MLHIQYTLYIYIYMTIYIYTHTQILKTTEKTEEKYKNIRYQIYK